MKRRFLLPLLIPAVGMPACTAVPTTQGEGNTHERAAAAGNQTNEPAAFAAIRRFHPFYPGVIGPHAWVAEGRVFCAFQRYGGQPIVMAYHPARCQWTPPVMASRKAIPGNPGDSHGNPALYIDRRGHLHLFHGCHGKAMRHTRSVRPYDVTEWEPRPAPAGET